MHLVQLLLPLYDNSRNPFARAVFAEVHAELVERFGGLTAYTRAPAQGVWKDEADTSRRDDIIIYEVMTGDLDRAWWKQYRKRLEKQFAQAELVIRHQEVELL